jgi:hypothetical protein
MKWIKDYMVNKQLVNETTNKNPREIQVPKELKSIGILANNHQEFKICKETLRGLFQYKIKILGYYFESAGQPATSHESVNHKHFSLVGQAKDHFNEFKEEKFDCILVPTTQLNPYLLSLLSANPHGFRMGFYSGDQEHFLDLMIDKKEEIELEIQIHELLKYLHKIN